MNERLRFELIISGKGYDIDISILSDKSYYFKNNGVMFHSSKNINYFILFNLFLTFIEQEKINQKSKYVFIQVNSIPATESPHISTISLEVIADFIAHFILKHFQLNPSAISHLFEKEEK